jgi:hypothetical protein
MCAPSFAFQANAERNESQNDKKIQHANNKPSNGPYIVTTKPVLCEQQELFVMQSYKHQMMKIQNKKKTKKRSRV